MHSAWAAALAGAAALDGQPPNLLPPERRESVSRGRLIPTFVLAVCVIAVVIALALQKGIRRAGVLAGTKRPDRPVAAAGRRSSAVDAASPRPGPASSLLDRYRARTKDDIDIINELTRLLPPPVWISSLEIHPDNVIIAGEADQAAPLLKAARFLALFRNSEFAGALGHNGAQRKLPHQDPAEETAMSWFSDLSQQDRRATRLIGAVAVLFTGYQFLVQELRGKRRRYRFCAPC